MGKWGNHARKTKLRDKELNHGTIRKGLGGSYGWQRGAKPKGKAAALSTRSPVPFGAKRAAVPSQQRGTYNSPLLSEQMYPRGRKLLYLAIAMKRLHRASPKSIPQASCSHHPVIPQESVLPPKSQ